MSSLPSYLRSKRETLGISQAEVARNLGYSSPQFISNWERGLSCPPLEVLKSLAKIYKTSPQALFDIYLKTSLQMLEDDLRQRFSGSKKSSKNSKR